MDANCSLIVAYRNSFSLRPHGLIENKFYYFERLSLTPPPPGLAVDQQITKALGKTGRVTQIK
jgi:hypothetical protein